MKIKYKKPIDTESIIEDIISGLQNLFNKNKNSIELVLSEKERELLKKKLNNIVNVTNIFRKGEWEMVLKESLVFSITDEFVDYLFKEELLITDISQGNKNKLKKFSEICYLTYSEESFLLPAFIFTFHYSEKEWFEFVLENSSSKDIQKHVLINCFGGYQENYYDFRTYLVKKFRVILKNEIKMANDLLDEYLNNKYKEFQSFL